MVTRTTEMNKPTRTRRIAKDQITRAYNIIVQDRGITQMNTGEISKSDWKV